jgi:membrane protein YdbS with pleckstrin-like domain
MAVVTEDAEPAGEMRALDPRYVPLQRLVGLLTSLAQITGSLIPLGGVLISGRGPSGGGRLVLVGLWLAFATALIWHKSRWPVIEYAHTRYRVDDTGIEIRRGVFWRGITSVPRSRVQHTDVSQGPLERRYGLGTLVIYTAGTDHAKVSLAGLAHEDALALRDRLTPGGGADAV